MTSVGRVLVAHGNTKRLRVAVDLMRDLGFEVIATPDGGDAFARFFEEQPAVVLCSAQLPGLSGVSFAAMVQSQAPATHVAILVDPEEPVDTTGAPGVPLITEPLTAQALGTALPNLPTPDPSVPADNAIVASSSSGVFALAALKRFQRDNTLLSVVDEAGLARMAELAAHELRMSDEQIITEGDAGTGFYLVVEGQVRVTLAEKNNQEIARIGAGGFFGEMAMLSDRKRSASVWSVGPTTLLYFAREQFLPLLDAYPTLREVLSGVALKRTEENLWRTLFEDDDVQRSIGSLSEPSTPITALQPPPAATWNQQTPPGGVKLPKPGPDVDVLLRERDAREAALRGVHAVELTKARRGGVRQGGLAGALAGVALGLAVGFALAGRPVKQADVTVVERAIEPPAPQPAPPPPLEEPPPPPPPDTPVAGEPALATSVALDPEMKRLRRELMSAERGGNHARAITAGLALESAGGLDWEAGFFLARAQQQGGQATQALTRYTDFIAAYPRNDFTDEAYFYSGEILQARGRKQEAIVAFQNVVTRPKSSLIEQAKAKLAALGAPVQ